MVLYEYTTLMVMRQYLEFENLSTVFHTQPASRHQLLGIPTVLLMASCVGVGMDVRGGFRISDQRYDRFAAHTA